jgi:hypothetical protein
VLEYALVLAAMNAPRHQWLGHPPREPAPVLSEAPKTDAPADAGRRQLQRALDEFRKRATGNLRLDREMMLYVPEILPIGRKR